MDAITNADGRRRSAGIIDQQFEPRRAWTVAEVVRLSTISRSVIYQAIASGRLRSIKIGRSRRVLDADLTAFLESLRDDAYS